jgi:hypothetical protein
LCRKEIDVFIENVVIGTPIVYSAEMFSYSKEDWYYNEVFKTHYSQERYLPKLLVECGLVKSVSEVLRNKIQFKIMLDKLDFIEIKWGKRKLFILFVLHVLILHIDFKYR